MRILITGGSGFLARHVARALQDDGDDVSILTRGEIEWPVAQVFRWSGVTDVGAVRVAVQDVDAVVHLAARVHVMRDRTTDVLAAFRDVNVRGTETLLGEARHAGVRHFVYFSSVKAAAESSSVALTEAMDPRPADPYGVSKREAELLVLHSERLTSMQSVIVRLPLAYGPAMKGNMVRLFRLIRARAPLPFASIRNRRSMVFSGNVGWAVSRLLHTENRGGGIFYVADAESPSTPELLRMIGDSLNRPPLLIPIPLAALNAAGKMGDLVNRFMPFPVASAEVQRLTESLVVDTARLRSRIGAPPHTLRSGLQITADWFLGK